MSADYRFNPAAMVYGTVSTGFRSDGAQPRPFTPGQQQVPVPAEELIAYEIGTKLDLFDRRLRVNVAAFMDDYDPRVFISNGTQCNLPSDLDPGPGFHLPPGGTCPAGTPLAGMTGSPWVIYDSAPGKDRGLELEVTADPVPDLSINASIAWFDFKSSVGPTVKDGRACHPNFGYVDPSYDVQAELSGSFGAQYRFQVGGGSLIPRLDWFYQGSRSNGNQYIPQLPEARQQGTGLRASPTRASATHRTTTSGSWRCRPRTCSTSSTGTRSGRRAATSMERSSTTAPAARRAGARWRSPSAAISSSGPVTGQ